MLIGLMLITFVTLWVICFILFERDLVCPAMLLISGYTICVVMAFLSNISFPFEYHVETFFVLAVGTLLFLLPAYAFKVFYTDNSCVSQKVSRSLTIISPWLLLFHAVCVLIAVFVILSIHLHVVRDWYPNVTYANVVPVFRKFLIYHPEYSGLKEIVAVNQLKKIFYITVYFLLFVYVRNCVIRGHFFKDKLLLLNVLLAFLFLGTEGGRASFVSYVVLGLTVWFFFDRFYNGSRVTISLKLLTKLIGGGFLACALFFGLLWITGRKSGGFDLRALWVHIQIYLAGPIPLLDNFLETGLIGTSNVASDFFGKETFYATNTMLMKLHVISGSFYSPHLEFRPGVWLGGNCYTAYRRYLYDFGYAGLILCPLLFSVIVNWLYYAAVRSIKKHPFTISLMIYVTTTYSIFIDFESSGFLEYVFSSGMITSFLGFGLLLYVLRKMKWMKFTLLPKEQNIENDSINADREGMHYR